MSSAAVAAAPMVDRWNEPAVTATLQGLGAADVKDATLAGQPGLIATTRDGLAIGLYAKACTPGPASSPPVCRGLEGVALFDPGAAADPGLLVDRLNHDHVTGKFMLERDGSILMTHYVNLDGGISPENLRAELADFFAVAAAAKRTVWAAPAR